MLFQTGLWEGRGRTTMLAARGSLRHLVRAAAIPNRGLNASNSTLAPGARAERAAILQQLAAALEYEKNSAWENVKGQRMFFSEHLVGVLEQLARDKGSLAEEWQEVAALLERARQYSGMTVKHREELLLQVTSVLQLPPPALPTVKASFRERASRYNPSINEVIALQKQYRQQPQQQQQQQQQRRQPQPQQQQPQQQQQARQPQSQQPPSRPSALQSVPPSPLTQPAGSGVLLPGSPVRSLQPPPASQAAVDAAPGGQMASTPAAASSSSSDISSSSSKQTQRSGVAEGSSSLPSRLPSSAQYQPPSSYSDVVPILFDLETNGMGTSSSWIVQLAAKNLATQEVFSRSLRLGEEESMDVGATRVTGLSTAYMKRKEHPPRREVLHEFSRWAQEQLDQAPTDAVLLLLGHNIAYFDCPILIRNMEVAEAPPLPPARLVDTLVMARNVVKKVRVHKLQSLAEFYGYSAKQTHQALDDVLMNEYVLNCMLRQMGEQGTSWKLLLAREEYGDWWTPLNRQWLGQIDWRTSGTRRAPKGAKKQGAAAATTAAADKEELALKMAFKQAQSGGEAPAAAAAGEGEEEEGEEFGWEDEVIEDLTDPVVQLEQQQQQQDMERQGKAVAAEAPGYAELAAAYEAWRQLLAGGAATCRTSFLDRPLNSFKEKGSKFGPKRLECLAASGVTTLSELLEYYPKQHRSAVPGRLPTEEEEPVCLPVRLVGPVKVGGGGGGRASVVSAVLEVVPPQQLGLPNPPGMDPAGAQGQQPVRLKLAKFSYSIFAAAKARKDLAEQLADGGVVYGRVVKPNDAGSHMEWELKNGEVEVLSAEEALEAFQGRAKIEPVYVQCGKMLSKDVAAQVDLALKILEAQADSWQDPLPDDLVEECESVPQLGYLEALKGFHRPQSAEQLEECRQRLAFQELLALQLRLLLQRHLFRLPDREEEMEGVHINNYGLVERAVACLPYKLTGGQVQALAQLKTEMAQWPPMMCLLQGDVGCGKTIVAFLALLAAAGSGYQGAIMAPTEILAEQHFANLQRLLDSMRAAADASGHPLPNIALLTGSVLGKERSRIYAGLADGSIQIVVGTHALTNSSLEFKRLGLAVVDEQHRFGVSQRSKLRDKSCPSPHLLYMTATPIPRTSALVLHGDMSQVVIDELPPGRTPVVTRAVLDSPAARHEVYEHMQREIAEGGQVYIICPLVEESKAEGMEELKAAKQEMERLVAEGIFTQEQCGLLYGPLKSAEKDAALRAFATGKTPVLISTTVVEVGVDVPAASLMLVEHADRFGLAQLHQLRGRVGRGARASTCYLVADKPENMARLRVMEAHSSGFHVAEADLWLRGPGEVLGTSQSGKENLSALKVCKLPEDRDLVPEARKAAAKYLSTHSTAAGPATWHPELLSLVFANGIPQLDISDIPNAAG